MEIKAYQQYTVPDKNIRRRFATYVFISPKIRDYFNLKVEDSLKFDAVKNKRIGQRP